MRTYTILLKGHSEPITVQADRHTGDRPFFKLYIGEEQVAGFHVDSIFAWHFNESLSDNIPEKESETKSGQLREPREREIILKSQRDRAIAIAEGLLKTFVGGFQATKRHYLEIPISLLKKEIENE
jgi:hypothetical protein